MNTVLDDSKVLTLLNGDRISLPTQVGLIFEVEDLAVAYNGKKAIKNINMKIPDKAVTALIGPSGCGNSISKSS